MRESALVDVQLAGLTTWARRPGSGCDLGCHRGRVRAELVSGPRCLSDPDATVVVVEHRDRLARFGAGHVEAALAVQGRRVVVVDRGETGVGNRVMRTVTAAKRESGRVA